MDVSSQRERMQIRKQLLKEIKILKDRKGFLRAGRQTFNRLFGRDSLIAAWQLLDWNPEICKATLEVLSQEQGRVFHDEREEEPGKILHETDFDLKWHPGGLFPFPYYGSVDSTPLFLIVFAFYHKKTRDRKFLERHWENILMALHWMEENGNRNGNSFLEYERKNPKGLYHQGWKDGTDVLRIKAPIAIVEAQGYQYLALREVSDIAKQKKDRSLSEQLAQRADVLKLEFNKRFWMKNEKYFALAIDGKKKQRGAITSNPGHCLFTGIIDEDKLDDTVARLFQEDMWTPYGIRTLSTKDPDFSSDGYHLGAVWPHDNWIIAQGLKKLGYQDEYQRIRNALFFARKEIGHLPELYGVADNKIVPTNPQGDFPQAWATGALFNFLGVGVHERIMKIPAKVFRW